MPLVRLCLRPCSVSSSRWLRLSGRPQTELSRSRRRVFSQNAGRWLSSETTAASTANGRPIPFRKQLKEEAKARKLAKRQQTGGDGRTAAVPRHNGWELTVGIEVHAQLDTDAKLFSRASTAADDSPNTNVALFDIAFPGSQPWFQSATLIPALRAAIAFNCDVQRTSRFDRKHYFYHDQPAGYQITQYYEPYAKNGSIELYSHDGIAPEDGESVRIGIQQIQMEQDTAKSQETLTSASLLDFNRVARPLIEIITLPQIHSPATAAACVRKIQAMLQACGAVTTGMEMGGMRADVNVSVRRQESGNIETAPLGQRTEIKNLSSIKAVEDAVSAERDRQIAILEAGGAVEGETRGWTIGGTETRRLRAKEGEVDYRYMPDPDIAPVIIGDDILGELRSTMPALPDEIVQMLTTEDMYGLSIDDAKPLSDLDDGARLEYYQDVVDILNALFQGEAAQDSDKAARGAGKTAGNWVLHQLGGLFSKAESPWDPQRVTAQSLAEIIHLLSLNKITGSTAKTILAMIFEGDSRTVQQIVTEEGLLFHPLSREEYIALAQQVIEQNPQMVKQIREKGQMGKIGFFVGQIKRIGEKGRVEAQRAEQVLRELLK